MRDINLYNYFRSSASYRVRIALNIKGLDYKYIPVHLTRDGGEQFKDAYKSINDYSLVPTLETGEFKLHQSLAIMEYLEEVYPEPPIIPGNAEQKVYIRSIAMDIACEIHPLNNLRVLKFITSQLGLSEEQKLMWVHRWINLGFEGLESILANSPDRGKYCFGDSPTMADCCLVPQIFNARRFKVDMDKYPVLSSIETESRDHKAFIDALPENQPDAE
ncbi:MAG: maleylacetoacetate isomerase [Gammaproteobacteria bacterium]|nr:maleylacetoacetate isomerase [Gammaproteobacteria bacterium]